MPVVRVLGTLLLVGCLAGFLGACGSSSRGGGAPGWRSAAPTRSVQPYKIDGVTYTPQEEFNRTETGVASWYGPGFHGKSTANGERYDQSDRTAAHRTLQMPAIVRVTNLDNGMSTVVRINDRGPFARSRVIDLSRTAAQELDVVRNGTARVRIDQLPAESMAVRDVAIAGGGPAEQNAAVAQVASGQRTAPAPTMAAAPPPAQVVPPPQPPQPVVVPAQPARRSRCGRRRRSRRRWRRRWPQGSGGRGVTVASLASGSRTGGRDRHLRLPAAASMCRQGPSRRWKTPSASAARCAATASRRFPRHRPADVTSGGCGWGPIRPRMLPASSRTG